MLIRIGLLCLVSFICGAIAHDFCASAAPKKEISFLLEPKGSLTTKELTELIMIQHPRIHQETYDKLSPDLKTKFRRVND